MSIIFSIKNVKGYGVIDKNIHVLEDHEKEGKETYKALKKCPFVGGWYIKSWREINQNNELSHKKCSRWCRRLQPL